jgi:inosine-uridine nucleoside N-ribohydrolase
VTRRCTLPADEASDRFAKIGGALEVVAAANEVWSRHADRVVFHDPLAGVSIFKPEVCTWAGGQVGVELASRRLRGATWFDAGRDGSPHEVATDVDADRFLTAYFDVF